MVEILVLIAISVATTWALARTTGLPIVGAVLLGPVVGSAVYVSVVTLLAATVGLAHPAVPVAITVLIPTGLGLRRQSRQDLGAGLTGAFASGVAVGLVGLLASLLDATRLNPDSLTYLAIADILTEPSVMERLRPYTIVARNVSTGALHTLGVFDGRAYAEAVTPVVTGFGVLAMLWLLDRLAARRARATRYTIIGSTALFCLLAGRPLFDAFYVNSHGPVMAWFFVLTAGGYLIYTEQDTGWAVAAALAAPAILVARPEGPLLVALGMLPALTHRSTISWKRWLMPVPSFVVAAIWYGAAAIEYPSLAGLTPGDLAIPAIVIAGGLVVIGVLAGFGQLQRFAVWLPWIAAAGLAAVFAAGTISDPETTAFAIESTAVNLTTAGGWGLAWPVLMALIVVAIAVSPLPHDRLLLAPMAGFFALFWASTVLRGGGYRVGAGDSGNRMLAHVFLVAVFYAVATISHESRAASQEAESRGPKAESP